jgi:hypothetical protein
MPSIVVESLVMKHWFSKINPKKLFLSLLILVISLFLGAGSPGPEKHPFPSLGDALKIASKRHADLKEGKPESMPLADLLYQVQDYYYQLQSKNEQLSIAKEVQGHFEKAVNKAEEIFDEGEEDISQSDITKLKLGLSGTRNDVITLNSEIRQASLSLNDLLGAKLDATRPLPGASQLKAVLFSHTTMAGFLADFLSKNKLNSSINESNVNSLSLERAFIRVEEAKDKLKLAKNSRKISRTLLVTEAANYDFGIGDTADLFQALIIYTRVLNGYYQSIYQFNLAVADLNRLAAKNSISKTSLSK